MSSGSCSARRALRDPAVAACRDPAQRGLARSADPDRRARLLHRARPLPDVLEAPARAGVLRPLVGERDGDRVDRLVGDRAALGERHAERVELAFDVAGADADDRAAARERVERRERLGGLQRVLVRGDEHVRHHARARRAAPRGTERRRSGRTTASTSSRRVRAGSRRDGTPRRRGTRRRRTPRATRDHVVDASTARAPTSTDVRTDSACTGSCIPYASTPSGTIETESVMRQSLIPARRRTAARCTRAGRTRRRRGRRR